MQYTTLGRTGLKVSVAGLGCGGFSKLGLGTGQSAEHAVGIIRQALDLGVNLIDTAAVYGTEDGGRRRAEGRARGTVSWSAPRRRSRPATRRSAWTR